MTLIIKTTLTPWAGERLNGILHPRNIEHLWSDADLAALDLYRPEPFAVPAGHVTTGTVRYEWTGTAIRQVYDTVPIVYTASHVKAEAQRRILALTGSTTLEQHGIRSDNAIARQAELARIMGGTMRDDVGSLLAARALTPEEDAEDRAIATMWRAIKVIRTKSNEIEALSPIPADYAADSRWGG